MSKLKNKIKELKKTSRGKAILKLIKWGIFFLIIFIFCIVASLFSPSIPQNAIPSDHDNIKDKEQPSESEQVIDEKTEIIWLLEELASSNYDYEYEIIINDIKYIFNGTQKDGINNGYKESNEGIIKYYIDDTGIYQETTTDKALITNLYENINVSFLDLKTIVNTIKNLELTIPETICFNYPTYMASDTLNIYFISYADGLDFKDNYINIITIQALDKSYRYTLKFSNVEVQK